MNGTVCTERRYRYSTCSALQMGLYRMALSELLFTNSLTIPPNIVIYTTIRMELIRVCRSRPTSRENRRDKIIFSIQAKKPAEFTPSRYDTPADRPPKPWRCELHGTVNPVPFAASQSPTANRCFLAGGTAEIRTILRLPHLRARGRAGLHTVVFSATREFRTELWVLFSSHN